jgi:UDP-glucose 4-epimerase
MNLHAAAERHSRAGSARSRNGLEVIIGDVRDRELLRKALRGVKYVFHLAALPESAVSFTGVGETHSVNVEGTLNVLHGALTEGVWRVVLASCSSVYGIPESLPVSEDAPLRPMNLFAASKVAAETYGHAFHARHNLDTVTLRYFSVYGPRQKAGPAGSLVPNLIDALRQGRLFDEQDERSRGDLTYVDDVVRATLAAGRAPRAAGRVINIGSGEIVSVADTFSILADLMKAAVVPGRPRDPEVPAVATCADTRLSAEMLDFTPRVSLIAGLARVVRSMVDGARVEREVLASVGFDE